MKKSRKILLGVLALWPILFLLILLMSSALFQTIGQTGPGPGLLTIMKILLWSTAILVLAQLIGYAVHIIGSSRISKMGKFQYSALLLLGHVFTLPLIWKTLVWKEKFLEQKTNP